MLRYSKEICDKKFRIICLDCFAISTCGNKHDDPLNRVICNADGSIADNGNGGGGDNISEEQRMEERLKQRYDEAIKILGDNNENVLKMVGGGDWFKDLPEEKHRFVPYNGSFGEEQRQWLLEELKDAYREKQYVVVFTHVPIHGENRPLKTLMWDSEVVLEMLGKEGIFWVDFGLCQN